MSSRVVIVVSDDKGTERVLRAGDRVICWPSQEEAEPVAKRLRRLAHESFVSWSYRVLAVDRVEPRLLQPREAAA